MFGILRTLLAMMVLVGHLTNHWQIGTYAVFAFYIISGYLMTRIMQQRYGYTLRGRGAFAINRVLRLYPLYWLALLLSILVVLAVGEHNALAFNEVMHFPDHTGEWLGIATMLYIGWFPNEIAPNLVPTTWAITVELFFYLFITLGLSRTERRVHIWLALSALYTLYVVAFELGWKYMYFPLAAASLPFAIGAQIYFLQQKNFPSLGDDWWLQPGWLSVFLLLNALTETLYPDYFLAGFYVSLLISVVLCYQIALGGRWGSISADTDEKIGAYSYPIYLLHWQVGLLISIMLFGKPIHDVTTSGLLSLLASIVVVLLVSWLFLKLVDTPVQSLRRAIKQGIADKRT